MAKASIGGKAKYIRKDGSYQGQAQVAIPGRDMAETARQGARDALAREKQKEKPGDKWAKDMDKRRQADRKQIEKEEAEQDAAAERIRKAQQVFNPEREPGRAVKGNDAGYTREYRRSYLMYREQQANDAWTAATKLRAGREATVTMKALTSAGMVDESYTIRRETKAAGGGLTVVRSRTKDGMAMPGRARMTFWGGSSAQRNFIEELKGI